MINKKTISIFVFGLLYSLFICAEKAVIIIGPPGSGKGTQTVLLRDSLKWPLIGPSNILREERINNTPLATVREQNRQHLDVINALKVTISLKRLAHIRKQQQKIDGIIFDSWPKYPSTIVLATEAFFKQDKPLIIELLVDEKTLVERAVERKVCPNSLCGKSYGLGALPDKNGNCQACKTPLFQREGDNANHFPIRIKKYFDNRDQILSAHKKSGHTLHQINGNRPPEIVHKEIRALVEDYLKQS